MMGRTRGGAGEMMGRTRGGGTAPWAEGTHSNRVEGADPGWGGRRGETAEGGDSNFWFNVLLPAHAPHRAAGRGSRELYDMPPPPAHLTGQQQLQQPALDKEADVGGLRVDLWGAGTEAA